jgi:hypothetical protein
METDPFKIASLRPVKQILGHRGKAIQPNEVQASAAVEVR